MTKTAFLFPGQGSQVVGMAQDILSGSEAAREVMAAVEDVLGGELTEMMKNGPADSLQMTRNAQPALMTSALCVARALEEKSGQSLDQLGVAVAGHSLGEYAALAAAGVLDIADAATLLQKRGDAMQNAVPMGQGAMAALLGASLEQAEQILSMREWTALDIANDNAPGQVVISGAVEDVEAAIAAAAELGIRKGVKLPVSAPFHCRLMAPAAEVMASALSTTTLKPPSMPIYCNVTASPEREPEALRQNLITQVTGMVRWRETLLNMSKDGVERFVELGTGKVLTGLVKRCLPEAQAMNIETLDDLSNFVETL